MSQLVNIITGALDSIDVEGSIGGEAGNLLALADTVSQLTQGQVPELSNFISAIGELDLPDFHFAADLTGRIEQIRDLVPNDMLDVLRPLTEALENIDSGLGEGITDLIEPLVNTFRALQTLLHTDFNFAPAATEGGGETSSGTGGIVSDTPDTRIDPAQLQVFQNVLQELPEQPTVANLLQWVNDRVSIGRDDMVKKALRSIPYVDDLRLPLNTVLGWQSMSSADFQAQIITTLQTLALAISRQVDNVIAGHLQGLTDIIMQLDLTQLRQIVVDMQSHFDSLKDHIEADSLTDTVLTDIENEMAILLAQRDALAGQFTLTIKQQLERQLKIISGLPALLQEKMSALLLLLQPPAGPGQAGPDNHFLSPVAGASSFTGLENLLEQYGQVLENLLSSLDISDITEAFAAPGQGIEQAADAIDEAVTMVTLEITNRLNQVEGLVAGIDLPAIAMQAAEAIEDFTGSITGSLTAAFSEVRGNIETIATQISAAVHSFDPAVVVNTIEQGMDALAAQLQQPAIMNILAVAEQLKAIAARLDELSFTPITDTVVATIDDMKSTVQGLGNRLEDPLKGMLRAAVDALPDDLTPVTDPLVAGLGDLIEAGPIPLLEAIKDVPQQLVDAINAFDPGTLIGGSLSGPFQRLISEIEAFEPSDLLAPIDAEIENFKDRLRQNVKPGDLLDPLILLHEQILLDLDKFQPSAILAPVNASLTGAVAQLTNAIPIEGIFEEIAHVIDDIERILGADGVADAILQLLQRLSDYLAPFVNESEAISTQIRAWLATILDTAVESMDISALQPAFDSLNSVIDNTQATALQTLYDGAAAPIIAVVKDTLQPRTLMTEMVRSYSQLRSVCNGLAAAGSKNRIDILLTQASPTAPNCTALFTAFDQVVTVMDTTRQQLVTTLTEWDARFHGADGVLSSYRQMPASPQELKQWLADALDHQLLRPAQAIFEKFAPTGRLLAAVITPLVELIEALRVSANQIIAAPAALLAVGESLERIRERLQNINLNFISESIETIYTEVKRQVRGLDPRALKRTLNRSFEELISVIGLGQIVPVDALNQTDDAMDEALTALRQLDPEILITEVIQPKFDAILAPFVSALDISPALNSLTERLKPLESELSTEMDRVNQAYQSFLHAVPA